MVMIPLLGLLAGSFANVVIYRWPRGEEWVINPSHCPYCLVKLKWHDLVPLLSWVLLRGKCRHCQQPIGFIYPVVEMATALLWLVCFLRLGLTPFLPVMLAITTALLIMAFIDAKTKEIPDGIQWFLLGIGIIWNIYAAKAGYNVFQENFFGLFAVSVPLFFIAVLSRGGMGGGDIKLMAVCGFIIGWELIFLALALASIIGTALMLPRYLLRRDEASRIVPFGPFLAVGIFLSAVWGRDWIDLYKTAFLMG